MATKVTIDALPGVTIPVAALCQLGTKTVVYTGFDTETEALTDPVEVTTGMSDGETVEILSGLSAGETYHYAYYDTLVISNTPEIPGMNFGF